MASEAQDLRRQLKEAHMSRAMIYAAVYDELCARFGAEVAEAVMTTAIYRRGLAIGQRFAEYGPADLEGLCAAFLEFIPDKGRLFQPEVRRCDAGGLDIKFHACPLQEAWQAAAIEPEKVATLCRIAGVVDNGTFEAAGFTFSADTWQPGEDGCCFLHTAHQSPKPLGSITSIAKPSGLQRDSSDSWRQPLTWMDRCGTRSNGQAVDIGMKLTDRFVDTLPLPVKGNKRVPDSELPGFNALITKAGWRGYVLRYRIRGRARSYTIGSRSAWSTIAARNRARELRRLIDQGIDPHEREAQERNEAITVGEFWTRVYAPLHLPNLRPATRRNIRSMMVRDVLPRIGRVPVKELDRGDVAALHREVSKRAPIRANRVRTAISSLMSWAEQPHVLEDSSRIRPLRPLGSNPCRGVRLNPEERRQRFLTPAEISRLIAALDGRHARQERSSVALVKFLLLTGARFSEAARADWSQFDLTAGIWVKPSSHTKQKRTHTTPLAAPALALLQQLGETTSSEFLFPGRDGRPLTKVASLWRSLTREAGLAGVRIHDLRHSFASLLASGGESLLLIGQLLGHSNPAVTARYAHLIDDVQRQAVERVAAVITGQPLADVVPMRQKKR